MVKIRVYCTLILTFDAVLVTVIVAIPKIVVNIIVLGKIIVSRT